MIVPEFGRDPYVITGQSSLLQAFVDAFAYSFLRIVMVCLVEMGDSLIPRCHKWRHNLCACSQC